MILRSWICPRSKGKKALMPSKFRLCNFRFSQDGKWLIFFMVLCYKLWPNDEVMHIIKCLGDIWEYMTLQKVSEISDFRERVHSLAMYFCTRSLKGFVGCNYFWKSVSLRLTRREVRI
jgi:hypothetical protein